MKHAVVTTMGILAVSTIGFVSLLATAGGSTAQAAPVGVTQVAGAVQSADGTPPSATMPADDRIAVEDSMYCRAVAGREPSLNTVAAGKDFTAAWNELRSFEFGAEAVAPAAIHADWQLVDAFTRDVATPAVINAGYQPDAVPAATADVLAARTRIAHFDAEVCAASTSAKG